MNFIGEKEWSESSECHICKQPFQTLKGIFRHHWFLVFFNKI